MYINLCVNNLSQFNFGLFGAQARFVSRIYLYQKTIQTIISIYVCIRKTIRTNIQIYLYQKNYTNMIQTNICIGKLQTCYFPLANSLTISGSWFVSAKKRLEIKKTNLYTSSISHQHKIVHSGDERKYRCHFCETR